MAGYTFVDTHTHLKAKETEVCFGCETLFDDKKGIENDRFWIGDPIYPICRKCLHEAIEFFAHKKTSKHDYSHTKILTTDAKGNETNGHYPEHRDYL